MTKSSKVICLIILPFLALVTLRYNLEATLGETYLIHNAIADSILDGNKWGLHALVKLLDIPLVPTLGLVFAKLIAVPLALNPVILLTAVSQVTVAFLLGVAIRRHWHGFGRYVLVALVVLPAIPFFRNLILINDPNWISAIPLLCALFGVEKFRQNHTLNPLIVVGICLSILVFCGPTLIICATAILLLLTKELDPKNFSGARCIIWMPFVYAILLWMPWTFNAEENFILAFFHSLSQAGAGAFRLPFAWQPFTAAAVAALILAMKTKENLTAICLLPLVLIIPLLAALSNAAKIANPAADAAIVIIFSCLIINAFTLKMQADSKTPQIAALLALAIMGVSAIRHPQISFRTRTMPEIVLKEAYKPQPPPIDLFDSRDAPDAQTLITLADQQWKGSRIIVPGERLITKVYPDPKHKHFRPLPDYTPRTFKELAATECFHLIVPPNDGRFYGSKSHLARIHAVGAPYLFLVAQLDNGWQLWKSLPPKTQPNTQPQKQ